MAGLLIGLLFGLLIVPASLESTNGEAAAELMIREVPELKSSDGVDMWMYSDGVNYEATRRRYEGDSGSGSGSGSGGSATETAAEAPAPSNVAWKSWPRMTWAMVGMVFFTGLVLT